VEAAWQAGMVVVVAAGNDGRDNSFGNDGYGTIGAPGNDPYVITVGAMKTEGTLQRSDDLIASYSSRGPTYIDLTAKPDLVAPGERIISCHAHPEQGYEYKEASGTSAAAPHVSGAIAAFLSGHKEFRSDPESVKRIFIKTATDLGRDRAYQGAGLVDLLRAMMSV